MNQFQTDIIKPTAYINRILAPDEIVYYQTKLHGIIFFIPTISFSIALAMATLVFLHPEFSNQFAIALALIGLIPALKAFVRLKNTEFAITSKRIIFKEGFLHCKSIETIHRSIGSIKVNQSLLGRILDYGTIEIRGITSVQPFPKIQHPFIVKQVAEHAISTCVMANQYNQHNFINPTINIHPQTQNQSQNHLPLL